MAKSCVNNLSSLVKPLQYLYLVSDERKKNQSVEVAHPIPLRSLSPFKNLL